MIYPSPTFRFNFLFREDITFIPLPSSMVIGLTSGSLHKLDFLHTACSVAPVSLMISSFLSVSNLILVKSFSRLLHTKNNSLSNGVYF